jgi:hypothetical protein
MKPNDIMFSSGGAYLDIMSVQRPNLFILISAIIRGAGNCNGFTVKDL